MATQPNPQPPTPESPEEDHRLTREQGWDLIFSLFGSAKEAYAEYGGSDAFMHAERAAWDEDDLD